MRINRKHIYGHRLIRAIPFEILRGGGRNGKHKNMAPLAPQKVPLVLCV